MTIGTPANLIHDFATSVQSFALNGTFTITQDDLVIVGVGLGLSGTGNSVSSITDSSGNTYRKAIANTNGTSSQAELWFCEGAAAMVAGTMTVSLASTLGGSDVALVAVAQCSGIATSSSHDSSGDNAASDSGSTSFSVATNTLAQAAELVMGFVIHSANNPFTQTGVFTNLVNFAHNSKVALSYDKTASTNPVTFSGTWGSSAKNNEVVACFSGVSLGATPQNPWTPWPQMAPIMAQ